MKHYYDIVLYSIIAVACFAIDRFTKLWALKALYADAYDCYSWLSWSLVFNKGFSWGVLHGKGAWYELLVLVSVGMLTLGVIWHAYYLYTKQQDIVGHVLIITGSVSNILDRCMYGGVIDFILLQYGDWSWPIFNCADIFIVVGVLCMFYCIGIVKTSFTTFLS